MRARDVVGSPTLQEPRPVRVNSNLSRLRIDRARKQPETGSGGMVRWAKLLISMWLAIGCTYAIYRNLPHAREVQVMRISRQSMPADSQAALNAAGYIVAARRIEVAASVPGRVAWTGVEKGDEVHKGQLLVRLEDSEYRARVLEAEGRLQSDRARLAALEQGSRPEEIRKAAAEVEQVRAEVSNARTALERTQSLFDDKIISRQALDDARARYNVQAARLESAQHAYELVRTGPRAEEIEAMRGTVRQSEAALAFANIQLENTAVRAPVSGTVLARNVEKGEFVTNGFAGEHGARSYVVSLADLNELDVELDISQNDFARLGPGLTAMVTTDAYPDRRYTGQVRQISPEANRDKATVQVRVAINRPDAFLRPDMNAIVVFTPASEPAGKPRLERTPSIPRSAIRDGAVFVAENGRVVRRSVRNPASEDYGLKNGDLLILHPAGLKDGERVIVMEGK